MILSELERQAWQRVSEAANQHLLAMLSLQTDPQGFSTVQSVLMDQLNRLGQEYVPWGDWAVSDEAKKRRREEQAKQSLADYETAFGKVTGLKVREAERKAKLYLLAVRLRTRASKENRKLSHVQEQWLRDADRAQVGDVMAWKRIANLDKDAITRLFASAFNRRDLVEDIGQELDE